MRRPTRTSNWHGCRSPRERPASRSGRSVRPRCSPRAVSATSSSPTRSFPVGEKATRLRALAEASDLSVGFDSVAGAAAIVAATAGVPPLRRARARDRFRRPSDRCRPGPRRFHGVAGRGARSGRRDPGRRRVHACRARLWGPGPARRGGRRGSRGPGRGGSVAAGRGHRALRRECRFDPDRDPFGPRRRHGGASGDLHLRRCDPGRPGFDVGPSRSP